MDLSSVSATLEDIASTTKGIEEQLVLLNKLLARVIWETAPGQQASLAIDVLDRVQVEGDVTCWSSEK